MKVQSVSLENLFVSKVRIKALKFFLLNPTFPIHLRGAVRELKEEINAVRRELLRLVEMELITEEKQGNRKYYTLNLKHVFIDELLSIFHKSYGLGADISRNHALLGSIDFAFLTSSYSKNIYTGEQQVDLAIIGDVNLKRLADVIKRHEDETGREIHYTVMKPAEFRTRKRRKDDFIITLFIHEKIMLVGEIEDMIR